MNNKDKLLVEPQKFSYEKKFDLESGDSLEGFEIVYETYGQLNESKSNAILICHALSGNHHAAGYHSKEDKKPGWWDELIGPNKAFDTNKYFVVSLNNLGGCHGSTGPNSINKTTNEEYGSTFPIVTVEDWVKSQNLLRDFLMIPKWLAVAGGSLGGMQALQWSIDFPDKLSKSIVIAAAPKLSTQNIAFNEVARQSILSDPDFNRGDSHPKKGLGLARMLGHITYLSEESMKNKFGRELKNETIEYGYDVEFQIESYLRYQGETFSQQFNAHTYLLMTKALDYFDPSKKTDGDLSKVVSSTECDFLVISFKSDWRFSPERSKEIVNALITAKKPVSYLEIDSIQGHDSFLMQNERYVDALKTYLEN
tara:strand:+ start:21012 stop:22112 length:1101 start_codon:yes stop_codon:yes gene_type:complete